MKIFIFLLLICFIFCSFTNWTNSSFTSSLLPTIIDSSIHPDTLSPFASPSAFNLNSSPVSGDKFPNLGVGINSLTGNETSEAVDYTESEEGTGGMFTDYKSELVTSYSELLRKTNVSIDMNIKGNFTATASAKLMQAIEFNSKTQYLFVEEIIENPNTEIRGYNLKNEAKKIADNNLKKFFSLYGDEFVYKLRKGGYAKLVFQFSSSSALETKTNDIQITAAKKFLAVSLSASAKYSDELKSLSENKNVKIFFLRQGSFDAVPPDSLGAYINYMKNFPKTITPKSGLDNVIGIEKKSYLYAGNRSSNIHNLGKLILELREYIKVLNDKMCDMHESEGNIAFLKVHSSLSPTEIKSLERNVKDSMDLIRHLYNEAILNLKQESTVQNMKKRSFGFVAIPEDLDMVTNASFDFGADAINNKVLLGKFSTRKALRPEVTGRLSILGNGPASYNDFEFTKPYCAGWLQEHKNRGSGNFSCGTIGVLKPINFILYTYPDKKYYKTLIYGNNNKDVLIPPGDYYIYVLIDAKDRLLDLSSTNNNIIHEEDVISVPPGESLSVRFLSQ